MLKHLLRLFSAQYSEIILYYMCKCVCSSFVIFVYISDHTHKQYIHQVVNRINMRVRCVHMDHSYNSSFIPGSLLYHKIARIKDRLLPLLHSF